MFRHLVFDPEDEAPETNSFNLLDQLLAAMRESPYMLNLGPWQLEQALSKMVANHSDTDS
jgi:hypothetical protein